MEFIGSARVRSSLVAIVLVSGLGGCVLDPYIRSTPGNTYGKLQTLCSGWTDSPVTPDQAMEYAECMRRTMEAKAGRYAVMNNGGSVLLLNVAGLAAYRGYRGGNEASVAALTTGGAAMYGSQQYLYRKPREVIYWSGAGAIGCAIGIASRQNEGAQLVGELRDSQGDWTQAKATQQQLKVAIEKEAALRSHAPGAGCTQSVRTEWKQIADLVDASDIRKQEQVLAGRLDAIEMRMRRLHAGGRVANINLIAATNAIRDTVNRQLANEQPQPGELAQLLSGLKLPTLQAVSAKAPETTDTTENPQTTKSMQELSFMLRDEKWLGIALDLPAAKCTISTQQLNEYRDAAASITTHHQSLVHQLEEIEFELDALEQGTGANPASGDMLKLCPLARDMALLPFTLQLAQEGPLKITRGGSALVPINGGVPPFNAVPASSLKAGSLVAVAEATEQGGYRFKITASDSAEEGTHALIATDATGITRVFQVQVTK